MASGKEFTSRRRRHGFGKIRMPRSKEACAARLLSLRSKGRQPQLLQSLSPRACALRQEGPPRGEACAPELGRSPLRPQLEKGLLSNGDPAQPKINENILIYTYLYMYVCIYQFSPVAPSCPTLGDPMDCSTPSFPVHHQLPEFTQTPVHRVGDAIQPSHCLSSPSPRTFNLSQHQGLF